MPDAPATTPARVRRRCVACAATNLEAAFPPGRKPFKQRVYCCDCLAHPLGEASARISARIAEIAALRRARGHYRAPRPVWTAPLFVGLRP